MTEPLRIPPEAQVDKSTYLLGGPIDQSCVTLRFLGDDLQPDELTRQLGAAPTSSCRKGDICLRGQPWDRIEKTGKWLLTSGRSSEVSLEDQINALLDRLTGDMTVWRDLTRRFRSDLFCGVFLRDLNRGFGLEPPTLRRIARRGLAIGFDIHGTTDDSPGYRLSGK